MHGKMLFCFFFCWLAVVYIREKKKKLLHETFFRMYVVDQTVDGIEDHIVLVPGMVDEQMGVYIVEVVSYYFDDYYPIHHLPLILYYPKHFAWYQPRIPNLPW